MLLTISKLSKPLAEREENLGLWHNDEIDASGEINDLAFLNSQTDRDSVGGSLTCLLSFWQTGPSHVIPVLCIMCGCSAEAAFLPSPRRWAIFAPDNLMSETHWNVNEITGGRDFEHVPCIIDFVLLRVVHYCNESSAELMFNVPY